MSLEKRTPEITTLAAPSQLGHFLRLFLPLALLLGAIAFTLVSHDIDMRVQQHIHKEEATLEIAATAVYRDIQTIRHDIEYLSKAPAIADFFAHPQRVAALDHLDQTLRAISQAALFYDQVRLLDLNGREISRINRRENNSHIVPRHELQLQGQPSSFPLTEAMAGGNIAISPLDLGRKQHKPLIRFMAIISDSQGEAKGYLVLDYLADSMLANLRKITAHSPADFLFLDQDGGSLQTPEPAAEGGSLAGNPALFAHRQPEAWRSMQERASGVYKDDNGLALFRAVFPTRLQTDLATSSMGKSNPGSLTLDPDARRWLLVSTLSPGQQQAIFHENIEYAYLLLLTLLVILAMGCLLISKGRLEKEIATTKNTAITNTTYDAIIMMDHHGDISFWNKAAETFFGYQSSEALGQPIHTLITPRRPETGEGVLPLGGGGEGLPVHEIITLTATRKNGSEIQMELSLSAAYINEQWHALWIVREITERIRAEAKSHEQQQQVIQADKMISLGLLVSGVAHEINNPNSIIVLNTPLLARSWNSILPILDEFHEENGEFLVAGLDYPEMRSQIPRICEEIEESGRRIKQIVKDLKDYARQDSASHFDLIDLNSVVEAASRLTFNKIKNATNHFSTRLAKIPPVVGNRQRLEQVVFNLIQNSCEALSGPEKGIIITSSFDPGENLVKLAITDEGCGIDPQSITKVTDPFYTSKRTRGGTGLGLSVSAGIIKEHDATIQFQSDFGKGTTVTLAFKPGSSLPLDQGTTNA
ncbi:MAG: ATP-binding protein [Deltaproteobacteria bacterium]|nr:ATP-binding protein [Deltaproteobacteria bacterium]